MPIAVSSRKEIAVPIYRPTLQETQWLAYSFWEKRGRSHGHDVTDWLLAEDSAFFGGNYELVVSYQLATHDKIFLGTRQQQTCRFCLRTEPAVTFKKKAHALPELIGNKSVFSYYECDACNTRFSGTVEDHLGKLMSATSALTRIRSKGGISSYKTRAKKSRIDVVNGIIQISNHVTDNIVDFRPDDKELVIDAETPPLIPMAVSKCFAKMALSILPESELDNFAHTFAWIMDDDLTTNAAHFKWLQCYLTIMPGPMPDGYGWTAFFRRRDDDALLPYGIFVVTSMNQSFQIMLPCSHRDNHLIGHKVTIPYLPPFSGFDYDFGVPVKQAHPLGSIDRQCIKVSTRLHVESSSRTV